MDGNRIQTRQRTRATKALDQRKEMRQEHPNAMDDENSITGIPAMESAMGRRSWKGKGRSHKSPRTLVVPSYMDFAESSPAINSNLSRLEELARDIQSLGNNINAQSIHEGDTGLINQSPELDNPEPINQTPQTGHPDPFVHDERNSRLEDLFAHFQSQSHLSQPDSDDLGEKIAHLEEMFSQFTDEQRQKQKELDGRVARLEGMFTTFMEKYVASDSTTQKDVGNVAGRVSRLENLIINFLEQFYGINTAHQATSSTPLHFRR